MSQAPNYEFTAEENKTFRNLAQYMRNVGMFFSLLGILAAGGAIYILYEGNRVLEKLPADVDVSILQQAVGTVILFGALCLALGLFTRGAASSFRLVVDTEGDDISHLMNALTALKRLYFILFIIAAIGLAGLVIQLYVPLLLGWLA